MAATAPLSSPEKLRRRRGGRDGSNGATEQSREVTQTQGG